MKQKREHLDDIIKRLEETMAAHRASNLPDVTVRYGDLERLINASIWGDD